MRLALVMTAEGSGGVEQSLIPYATALQLAGHEVMALLRADSPLLPDIVATVVSVHPLLAPVIAPGIGRALDNELREVLTAFRTDLIIAFAGAGLPQVRRAVAHGLPVLTRCGDMVTKIVSSLLVADGLIATTPAMRDLAVKLGSPSGTVHILPNFLSGPPVRHHYRTAPPLRVGAMGRFIPRKGFADLIAAAAKLKSDGLSFDLVIAGDGSEKPVLQERAQMEGLAVDFPGWIANAEKNSFLAGLDVFVVPSRAEPFGNIQLEALQHGLPLITTATIGGTAIFAGTTAACLVPPGSVSALAAALHDLLVNDVTRENLGLAGQDLLASRYQALQAAPELDRIVRTAHASWQATQQGQAS